MRNMADLDAKTHANYELKNKGDVLEFYEDMKWLVNCEKYSDVKFVVGTQGVVMHGHKCILAARCKEFEVLFEDDEVVNSLVVDSIEPDHFYALLEFIYTNCCKSLNKDNVFDILTAAYEKELDKLIKICENFLLRNASIDNVCEYMDVAVTYGLTDLSDNLIVYFDEHTHDIFNSATFKELSAAALSFVLKSSNLKMDEYDIYMSIRSWATVNSFVLDQPINVVAKAVVGQLRLSLMTSEELSELEKRNEDNLVPVEQVSLAWKDIALKTPFSTSVSTTPRRGTKGRLASNK